MGQRLVVTIKDKNEPKMKIYYHWSAYTASTFEVLNDLWENAIKPLKRAGKGTSDILLGIIRHLEGNVDENFREWLKANDMSKIYHGGKLPSCHGGIGFFNKKNDPFDEKLPNEELAYIQSLYPGETFSTDVDRNNGLVYMSKNGMEDVEAWAEGTASIDLDTETFSNNINYCYHGKDEFIADEAYARDGKEPDPDEQAELSSEFDNLRIYDGDGSKLFEGRCEDIVKNWNEWDRLTDGDYRFRDIHDTVWEGIA